jgi:hypothetical protein
MIVVAFFVYCGGGGVFEPTEFVWVLAVPVVVRVVFEPADVVWALAVPLVVSRHEG